MHRVPVLMRNPAILALLLYLFGLNNVHAQMWVEPDQSAQSFRISDIRFFEGAYDAAPLEQRSYYTSFAKSSSRYIHTELYLENKLWGREDVRINLNFRYFKPDGSLFGEIPFEHTIPMAEQWYYFWQGWGWQDAGYWDAGRYRVEVWYAGRKLAENYFEITGTSTPQYSSTGDTFTLTDIRFFEAGDEVPDEHNFPYATSFSSSSTRYVYTELTIDNHYWNVQDNPLNFTLKYYKPDGTLFGELPVPYTVPMSWETAEIWHGWGWADPGYWESGQYRVEVWYASRKLGEDRFDITGGTTNNSSNTPASTGSSQTVSLTEIRFFEGGDDTSGGRIYNTRFSQGSSRYIYTEIALDNHDYNVKENPVNLLFKYYKEDGSLFGEVDHPFTIPIDWDVAEIWEGWGWPDAGNWEAGRYTVEIWNNGAKLGENYFNIAN
jgi:hypothetical protein